MENTQGNAPTTEKEAKKKECDLQNHILYTQNKAYIFIPFSYSSSTQNVLFCQQDFQNYVNALMASKLWIREKMKTDYLLKYITGKFDISPSANKPDVVYSKQKKMAAYFEAIKANRGYIRNEETHTPDFDAVQCFHFVLNIREFEKHSKIRFFEFFRLLSGDERMPNGIAEFMFTGAELFCFNSLVNILAIQVEFNPNVPIQIANAEFVLKNVEKYHIIAYPEEYAKAKAKAKEKEKAEKAKESSAEAQGEVETEAAEAEEIDKNKGKESILHIFENAICCVENMQYDIFYFANPGKARANMLTLLEVPEKEDYSRELFYLKRCYSDGYIYTETQADKEEIHIASKDVIWGLSIEAAVCLISPQMGRESFLKGTFFCNFETQYLLTYVILLHQKYVLYRFLTDINVRSSQDLVTLEKYKDNLYQFETDYVFSHITEVPQYQDVYDRLFKVFALKELYEDVHEPLISLSEVRYKIDEENQHRQDKKINLILFILSLLSIFSAWIDSYDFTEKFLSAHFGLSNDAVMAWQKVIVSIIFVTVCAACIYYRAQRNKKKNKK